MVWNGSTAGVYNIIKSGFSDLSQSLVNVRHSFIQKYREWRGKWSVSEKNFKTECQSKTVHSVSNGKLKATNGLLFTHQALQGKKTSSSVAKIIYCNFSI